MKIIPKKYLSEVLGWMDDILRAKDYSDAIGISHLMIAEYEEKLPTLRVRRRISTFCHL